MEIKIDTTTKKEERKTFIPKVKKTFFLLSFIYFCIPFFISTILFLRSLDLRKSFIDSNPYETLQEEVEGVIPKEKEKELDQNEWLECLDIIRSFVHSLENSHKNCENIERNINILRLGKNIENNRSEIEKLLKETKKLESEIKNRDFQFCYGFDLKYKKEKREWEKRSNYQLIKEKPTFFFIIYPLNLISEKIVLSLKIARDRDSYFYADVFIKAIIANIFIRSILSYTKNFFVSEKWNNALVGAVLFYINFSIFFSKDIIVPVLPNFWANLNNYLIIFLSSCYDSIISLFLDYSEKNPKILQNFAINFFGRASTDLLISFFFPFSDKIYEKKILVTRFFMNNLITERISKKFFFALKILKGKVNGIKNEEKEIL